MIKKKYLKQITEQANKIDQNNRLKFFIFGSSLDKKHFGDVDLGVLGGINREKLRQLKESFVDSALPYLVDVVDFDKASDEFKNNIFNNEILWIKH